MRKLMLILIAFIAVITFIRAFDNSGNVNSGGVSGISENIHILESEPAFSSKAAAR